MKLNAFLTGQAFPRQVDTAFENDLKALPPYKAEVWYRAEDPEAWFFAMEIHDLLKRVRWDISDPVAQPASRFDGTSLPIFGVQIRTKQFELFTSAPKALGLSVPSLKGERRLALLMAATDARQFVKDEALPDGFARIIVSARFVF